MSEQASSQAKAKAEVTMETPMFLNTKWAAVAVYGWQTISSKMLEVFGILLNLPFWNEGDHGIRAIVIGELGLEREVDGEMKAPLAECWPNGRTVGIDLNNAFANAIHRCRVDAPNASIFAWYTQSLFLSLLHETHHMASVACGEDLHADNEEELAEKFGHDALMDVAKQFVIEPEAWTDEPFFRDAVLGSGLELLDDEEWLEHQLHMLDNRLFYHLRESDTGPAVKCHTFKDFLHMIISGDEPNDETWLGAPIPVAPIAKAAADVVPTAPVAEVVDEAVNLGHEVAKSLGVEPPASETIVLPAGPIETPAAAPIQEPVAPAQESVVVPEPTDGDIHADTAYADQEYLEDMEYDGDTEFDGRVADYADSTPPPAAQQQATVAAAIQQEYGNVAPSAPMPAPEVNVYNPTSMDDQTLINVVQALYFKCYNHIFSYCGQTNTGFSHPSKVYELQLELTPQEAEAVVSMDCLDQNGRWCPRLPSKVQGMGQTVTARILGAETKSTKLPYYKLYINANGRELCRMLLPQNPLKQNGGQFSKPALAAQSGSRIMYIFEGNDDVARATGKKVLAKIVDGRWEQ